MEACFMQNYKSSPRICKFSSGFRFRRSSLVKCNVSRSSKKVEAAILPKKKSISHSAKVGIQFPVGRIQRFLRKGGFVKRFGFKAPVYFAVVLDYLVGELN